MGVCLRRTRLNLFAFIWLCRVLGFRYGGFIMDIYFSQIVSPI